MTHRSHATVTPGDSADFEVAFVVQDRLGMKKRQASLLAIALGCVALVGINGCNGIGPGNDTCAFIANHEHESLDRVVTACDGNVLVRQPTHCDYPSGNFLPSGPSSQEDCGASQLKCLSIETSAMCGQTCVADADCALVGWCSHSMTTTDGQATCQPGLVKAGSPCTTGAGARAACAPGLVCLPNSQGPVFSDAGTVDGSSPDAAGADGAVHDAMASDAAAGDGGGGSPEDRVSGTCR